MCYLAVAGVLAGAIWLAGHGGLAGRIVGGLVVGVVVVGVGVLLALSFLAAALGG